ncbi:hypothetical protein C4J84_0171 [Pseudomonas sp. R11-23-07]|nr:hypothetical protein C4J86_0172 [Pseudomonas sp. R2-7-07]AZF56081.1 hypothetical protein C4J84_0171 [Pseudomonas sp. R11-23-07]
MFNSAIFILPPNFLGLAQQKSQGLLFQGYSQRHEFYQVPFYDLLG